MKGGTASRAHEQYALLEVGLVRQRRPATHSFTGTPSSSGRAPGELLTKRSHDFHSIDLRLFGGDGAFRGRGRSSNAPQTCPCSDGSPATTRRTGHSSYILDRRCLRKRSSHWRCYDIHSHHSFSRRLSSGGNEHEPAGDKLHAPIYSLRASSFGIFPNYSVSICDSFDSAMEELLDFHSAWQWDVHDDL
jgi:hypothetical protein